MPCDYAHCRRSYHRVHAEADACQLMLCLCEIGTGVHQSRQQGTEETDSRISSVEEAAASVTKIVEATSTNSGARIPKSLLVLAGRVFLGALMHM